MKRARHQSINRPVVQGARAMRRAWVQCYPGRRVPMLWWFRARYLGLYSRRAGRHLRLYSRHAGQ